MQKIKKLSLYEAQKIAAGEVIERPVNLLKELLENAIDAGSTKIAVYIEDAGKALVRVSDNGCGMSPEDAAVCFEQYATSKITCVDELQRVNTFGFRGEALASIAAVGKVTLITKEADAIEGTSIRIEQSQSMHKESVCATTGTDIAVRDIFYNVPARRKFLKKRETEWHQIKHLCIAVCLGHLAIDFKIYNEDTLVYACSAVATVRERWAQLFDHAVSVKMIDVHHAASGVTITGLISDQHVQRYDRSGIYICVNGRWVNDAMLTRAFIKGYQQVLQPGRYPTGCIFIAVDPQEVDINIHPRKQEVRFMHPRVVEREIQGAVTKALESHLAAQLQKTAKPQPVYEQELFRATLAPPAAVHKPSFTSYDFDAFLQAPMQSKPSMHALQVQATPELFDKKECVQHTVVPKTCDSHYELIGQYKKTYLLLEQEDGLFMVDQHAAHERILYEQFLAQHTHITKVQLMFAQAVTLSPADVVTVMAHAELFSEYGIELEQFGADSVRVRATPIHLKNVSFDEIIKDAIRHVHELEGLAQEEFRAAMQKKLYADMACKAAVKAGDALSREQMQQLLSDLEVVNNRFLCPHGRPTSFLLQHDEIKRKFKRDYRGAVGE